MESFISIDPNSLSTSDLHKMLLLSVAPRPIALASTIDDNGVVNLSPFSCFNMFSANPPILIFSPSRRVRDNSTKDTLENIKKTQETPAQKIEDKTEPETGSTAKPVSNLDKLKKIMAKESVAQPEKNNTYKQTTFHASKARERRRDPFTGGREVL